MIKLQHIVKEYDLGGEIFTVLKDINLQIKSGEYTAILGPSGSGKSTLMHILGLLDKPSFGKVLINNMDVAKLNDDETSKVRSEFVGFVFQQFNLISKLTVLENVLLPTIYARNKLDFDPKIRAMEILKRFGVEEKANILPNRISGGQQQRVSIARALIMKPQMILADEPTGNLDTKNGNTIMELLEELNKRDKMTVVIVTHETDVAKRTKQQIKIVDGEIV